MTVEQFAKWLEEHGSIDGPEFAGFGHITSVELAERILSAFHLTSLSGRNDD